MTRLAMVFFAASLGACSLYSGDQPPPMCKLEATPGTPAFESRDPSTGQCQFIGGGGGGQCTPDCPCPAIAGGGIAPNWPMCGGACNGLDEQACNASDTCHAAYTGLATADQIPQFSECWDIAPVPVTSGGQCMGLDAWTCATHADCASFMELDAATGGETFSYCGAAPATTPLDPGVCDQSGVHCNLAPPACPVNTVPGVLDSCWSGYCIPTAACPVPAACETLTTEAACVARAGDCHAVYAGMNCTCTPDGTCTCQSETFDHCETFGRL